ncbi:MAG: hypothetical protein E6103_12055 [Enterococcus faecalis]|uniref:hypothetical protein n=1 Tax=Enterococcus TaxID=1350 RepID=UPI000534FD80|nr:MULTISPECIES: hypothetical protein [Enterococcus]MDH5127863.1 hypothetical protein [Enterococcus faecalis]MDQ8636347.1 hypothetical protein [Enterococcus sp. FR063]MDQ8652775.1 hypothetical protein [Enterococcus sp. FR068]MDQ8665131.1 hypothetical protein [Enterococcus sp. FR062]MDU1216507.1 hypothetical protein [Enterococcus faecalis]
MQSAFFLFLNILRTKNDCNMSQSLTSEKKEFFSNGHFDNLLCVSIHSERWCVLSVPNYPIRFLFLYLQYTE